MRITIKVIPGARKNMLKVEEGGISKVYLTAPPVEGKANQALIKFLAEHYHVNKSAVEIVKGEKSRQKVVEIKE
ncbi:MAG: YggU family protein [Candidatus Omnitrophica bacterium]|nr:YggU family protein [Candidatus Omnitrophota bacterium]MDE2222912.1 YggU family protein [Candidatus Omnitrophota bacterium]